MLVAGRLCQTYPTVAVTAWSFVGAAAGALTVGSSRTASCRRTSTAGKLIQVDCGEPAGP